MATFSRDVKRQLDMHKIRNKGGWPQLFRGYMALKGEYVNSASKTSAFVDNIMRPNVSTAICIDSHMIWSSLGLYTMGGTVSCAESAYQTIAGYVQDIAQRYNMLPSKVQAIIWIARKRYIDTEPVNNTWAEAWVYEKYSTHKDYKPKTNRMPNYTIDLDVFEHYASLHNLEWMFEQATKAEFIEGMNWYANAHKDSLAVADETGIELRQVVEAVSALSPGRYWDGNVWAARVLATQCQHLGIL